MPYFQGNVKSLAMTPTTLKEEKEHLVPCVHTPKNKNKKQRNKMIYMTYSIEF